MAIGCLLFASGCCWLYLAPIALALWAAKSPPALRGTSIGIDAVRVFAASIISGRLGSLYEKLSPN